MTENDTTPDSGDADSAHGPNSNQDAVVPKAVVNRLSLYLRELSHLIREGQETTSSTQLGSRLGLTDAQIRKDLAYFGQFGYPGIGYRCGELVKEIRQILGTDRAWRVGIVGLGNLGTALLGHGGFAHQGFEVAAAFDVDTERLAAYRKEAISASIPVYHYDRIDEIVKKEEIRLGILAVPAAAAQTVADALVEAGIEGIMNFAPVTISLPPTVSKVAVDLAIELEQLSFAVVNRGKNA